MRVSILNFLNDQNVAKSKININDLNVLLIDKFLDNHADIIFDNFFIKEFIILLYHCRESSDLLINNNFIEKE